MAHEIDPEYKVGNMMIYSASYPLTCKPEDVLKNQQYNRILNYFCSDVQCSGEYAKRYGFIYVRRYDGGTGDFARHTKVSAIIFML